MNNPLVTIVTPTYNQREYIRACIESVLRQTYPHWEQIVVDDGSEDGTPDVVESYGDPRIRCIRLPHRGLAALADSYNAALGASSGALVAILEGDDLWPPEKLEAQVPTFEQPDVFLSWGRAGTVDEHDRPRGERASLSTRSRRVRLTHREIFRELVRINLLTPSVTVMVRRAALDAIGGFQQGGSTLYVDLPTWLRLAALTPGAACYLNRTLGCYRVHGHQTTQRFGSEMSSQHLSVVMALVDELDPEVLAAAGWDEGVRRRAIVSARLAEGSAQLSQRRFEGAAATFRKALAEAGDPRDRLKASLGVVSAAVRRDLLGAAYALRERAAARGVPGV